MRFTLRVMAENYARSIAGWHYDGAYRFYDMDQDAEDLADLLKPLGWTDRYYAVVDETNALAGYFCFEPEESRRVEIGLGLRPDCTGQGLGQAFVEAGLKFAAEKFNPAEFCLSVATFNQRAIRLYTRLGFTPDGVFMNQTNGGQYEFLWMVKKLG